MGDDGGVVVIDGFSRSIFPPDPVMEEVLADKAASPFIWSGAVLAGDAKGLVATGYCACCITVFMGEEMVL